jgi:putative transferase (TIGR04331 family)
MAVLDYPGTTLAEVLAANIPTICFWNSEQWLLAPGAQPLFDRLKHAGILFERPEDAAIQVNAVSADIESWWQDPERQRARAEWCHTFAHTDRNWFLQWIRTFATL